MVKKVLVFGPRLIHGGLTTHFVKLLRFLESEGHDVHVLVEGLYIGSSVIVVEENYNSYSKSVSNWKKLVQFTRLIKFSPDIFISTTLGYTPIILSLFFRRRVFKIQQEVIGDLRWSLMRRIGSFTFNAIGVQSASMVERYLSTFPGIAQEKVLVLPCFSNAELIVLKDRPLPLSLVYVGRLAENKGLVEFLQNSSEVLKNHNILFKIYGDGPAKNDIGITIRKKNLSNLVSLEGAFEQKDLQGILSSHSGLILPSKYNEGLPLVLVEAMSAGLPMFFSNVGAMSDITDRPLGLFCFDINSVSYTGALDEWIVSLKNNEFSKAQIQLNFERSYSNNVVSKIWSKNLE